MIRSAMPRSLKEQNAWLLRTALVIHALAFLFVTSPLAAPPGFGDSFSLERLHAMLLPGSISVGVIALARLVLLGLVPPDLRDRMIFWRWRHPLPGSRAFSEIGPADTRVDMEALRDRLAPLPSDPDRQNSLFYSLYKAHSETVGVLDAHKSYLATRDIATINLLMFVLLPPLAYWSTHDGLRTAIYAALLLVAYLLFSKAAQIYGLRFVQNVLATAAPRDSVVAPMVQT